MPTPPATAPSAIARIEAFCSWLQAGGIASSESEINSWREECKALASLLQQEDKLLQDICASIHQVTSPSRLRAMLSLLTACILSPDAAAKLSYSAVSNIQAKTIRWACSYLDIDPERGRPSGAQLAVAEVLLRAKVLQGCSRQLASATAAVTAAGQVPHGVRRQSLTKQGDEEARALDDAISTVNCLLPALATLCGVSQSDSHSEPVTGQRATSSATSGCGGSEGQAGAVEPGGEMQVGKKEQEGGLLSPEAAPGAVEQVAQPAGLQQQLIAALYDSCVLEHFARGVLVQAGWLQRMRQAGRQRTQAYGHVYDGLSAGCQIFATHYSNLLNLQDGPGVAGADNTKAARRGFGGAPEQAHGGAAAPPTPHQHSTSHAPPLAASGQGLAAAHMLLLHRVLSGPCARHLVLCQALRALCALDKGGDYGLPEDAALQSLPLCVVGDDEERQSRHVLLDVDPLRNLVDMLAMRPCGSEAETKAQPPGRGTRLQLTLRVALAAVGAKAGASGGGGNGSQSRPRYILDRAASIAVYALRTAWEHMPSSRGPAQADRRRAALRRWAAAAEQVARSGVATAAHPFVAHNLGLQLGLHQSAVGPLEQQDLRALASGGHLLRASEGLVSQAARAVGEQARGNPSNPAGGTQLSTAAGSALTALVTPYGGDIRSCLLRNLLLQPGEDEQPGAGQKQGGEGAGAAGQGGCCSLAAASLAVALGKLLRRYEGALVDALGRRGDSTADDDGDGEGGDTLALGVMCVVCGVLLMCPCCAGSAHLDARDDDGDDDEDGNGALGADQISQGGEQAAYSWEVRRRVWVCSYATWQWLPALAGVARRAAVEGHVNSASMHAWQACLAWVTRLCLCLACRRKPEMAGAGLEARDGEGSNVGSRAAGEGCGGARSSPGAAGDSGGCSGGACAEQDGCWRQFLLQDVEVVGLLGAALSGVVPELLAGKNGKFRHLLDRVAQACVLAAVALPTEVAQYAWGAQGGAAGGAGGGSSGANSSGASGAVWSPKMLAELATVVGGEEEGQPLAGALRALEEWGGECGRAGGPVELSTEQRQLLGQAVPDVLGDAEGWRQVLPPLCELRAQLRVCSNPRCVALPPPGQTEAEAEAEAGGGRGACNGARSAAWYCCAKCHKQHGRAGRGQAQQG